jgi:hypothetical protein
VEPIGDRAGGHLAAAELQREQDVPALFVRERDEDRVEVLEPLLGE